MSKKLNKREILMAKFIAEENIQIIQNDAPTAKFNVKDRVLTLPMWDVSDDRVHMMLISHEVGHALYTPTDKWNACGKKYNLIGYDPFNIVEDVRIERLMLKRYPGFQYDYEYSYLAMFNDGLFGEAAVNGDWKKYTFWDRLNIWAKIRGQVEVPMSDVELKLAEESKLTETWDDVEKLVLKINRVIFKRKASDHDIFDMADMLKKLDKEFGEKLDLNDDDEDDDEDETSTKDEKTSDDVKEGQSFAITDEMFENMQNTSDDQSDKKETQPSGYSMHIGGADGNVPIDDVDPGSDNEEDLSDAPVEITTVMASDKYIAKYNKSYTGGGDTVFAELFPKDFDVEDLIISVDDVMKRRRYISSPTASKKKIKDAEQAGRLMAKEFEMRQSADRLARARESTKGSLDVTKLHTYKFNDKLFNQVTVLGDGQSHCMLMLIDYSASMRGCIADVMYQVAILAYFCRTSRIPFRAICFTSGPGLGGSGWDHASVEQRKYQRYVNLPVKMAEVINSNMPKKEFSDAFAYLLGKKELFCPSMTMNGTPLEQSILVGHELLVKLQEKYKVQKRTFVVLTDGYGSGVKLSELPNTPGNYSYSAKNVSILTAAGRVNFKRGYHTHGPILEAIRDFGTTVVGYDIRSNVYPGSILSHVDMLTTAGICVSKTEKGYDRHIIISKQAQRDARAAVGSIKKDDRLDELEKYEALIENSAIQRRMSRAIARNVSEAIG